MKRTIKIIATFITLIIVNYNMCFADMVITEPKIFANNELSEIIDLMLPLIFVLGIILVIIEIVTYIYKKKKSEETHKIEGSIYKTVIFLALWGSFYIFVDLYFYGGIIFGLILFVGSIISIIARKKKHIKLSNIVCGLVIINFFVLICMPFKRTTGVNIVEMQQFNEKFMQYEGDDVKGTQVNSLLQEVVDNNIQEDDSSRKIEVYFSNNCKDASGNTIKSLKKKSTTAPEVITKRQIQSKM